MDSKTPERLKKTLAEVVRDALIQGDDVAVPDFGVFRVENQPSEITKDENGRIVMRPPRDTVVFDPDES